MTVINSTQQGSLPEFKCRPETSRFTSPFIASGDVSINCSLRWARWTHSKKLSNVFTIHF